MKKNKVLVIGAGARSIVFCGFFKENNRAECLFVADPNIKKAEFLSRFFGLESEVVADYKDVIKSIEIDSVFVSTPDYLHVDPVVDALRLNKNVYIEKPLATTIEDCDKIIKAAKQSDSICYLGFNMRHSPVHEKVYELIHKDKRLGKITTIEANEWYYEGKTYFRRWNRLRKYGGGLWLTKACHDFDLITWIAGSKPQSIFASSNLSCYKPLNDAGPRCRDCKLKMECPDYYDISKPAEDNEFCEIWRKLQIEMGQEGEMAPDLCLYNSNKDTFDNGIAAIEYENGIKATYTVNVLAAKTTRQIRVIGIEGMAEADMETGHVVFTERHTGKVTTINMNDTIQGTHGGADTKILNDFFEVCKSNQLPRSDLSDGRLAVQMSLAARESSDRNKLILF